MKQDIIPGGALSQIWLVLSLLFSRYWLQLSLPYIAGIVMLIVVLGGITFLIFFFLQPVALFFQGTGNNPGVVILSLIGAIVVVYALLRLIIMLSVIPVIMAYRGALLALDSKLATFSQIWTFGWSRQKEAYKIFTAYARYVYTFPIVLFILSLLIWLFSPKLLPFFMDLDTLEVSETNFPFQMILILLIFLTAIIFIISRIIRSTPAFAYMVDNERYNYSDFLAGVSLVRGRWWRTIGNLIIFGLIPSITTLLVGMIYDGTGSISTGLMGANENILMSGALITFMIGVIAALLKASFKASIYRRYSEESQDRDGRPSIIT